jgi:hypothetical protein
VAFTVVLRYCLPMGLEDIPEATSAARHIVDGEAAMLTYTQQPGGLTGEFGSESRLRESLAVNTDWSRVLEAYLHRQPPESGGGHSPIDDLPTVVRYLRGNTRGADQQPDLEVAERFYGYLQPSGLLADPDTHASNVRMREMAETPPASAAAYISAREAQATRLTSYIGQYRSNLFNILWVDSGDRFGDVRALAELIAPATGYLNASSQEIRQPVVPELAPLDAQLHDLVEQHRDKHDADMYSDPRVSESLAVAIEGDQSLLGAIGMSSEEFRQMCEIAVHSYPRALMGGHTTFRLHEREQYRHSAGQAETGDGVAIIDLWPDVIATTTTSNKDASEQSDAIRLTALTEETIDHELAHIVHMNAPVDWLRRWDDMLQNGVSLSRLSHYAERVEDPVVGRGSARHLRRDDIKRWEQAAEAIQMYRSDPVSLIKYTESLEPLTLLQELLHSYSDDVLARELSSLQLPLDEDGAFRLRRTLAEDRQNVLRADLEAAGVWPPK